MHTRFIAIILTSLVFAPDALDAQRAESPDQIALRAVDERQRRMVHEGDVEAMRAFLHPDYRVNAPVNRVIGRDEILNLLGAGAIATERFERVAESVTVTGDTGVVMGRETIAPITDTLSGRMYGTGEIHRRYTNIYVRRDGEWLFLARHANVVPPEGE